MVKCQSRYEVCESEANESYLYDGVKYWFCFSHYSNGVMFLEMMKSFGNFLKGGDETNE
jgi:hypothetical protein